MSLIGLNTHINKHIRKPGTKKREAYEAKLSLDLFRAAIKKARIQKNLIQTQLGELVGVQKAQISKIENNVKSGRLETL
ncbi:MULTISPECIES: helix-turn-helix domain-containing protein [unclassified Paraflavitalea]|uniref:helix-turn-helix domain-containing protein n=1 Tax=unclassified Paraflavitalea TaxID=2798305 RepID=UPI003D33770A